MLLKWNEYIWCYPQHSVLCLTPSQQTSRILELGGELWHGWWEHSGKPAVKAMFQQGEAFVFTKCDKNCDFVVTLHLSPNNICCHQNKSSFRKLIRILFAYKVMQFNQSTWLSLSLLTSIKIAMHSHADNIRMATYTNEVETFTSYFSVQTKHCLFTALRQSLEYKKAHHIIPLDNMELVQYAILNRAND